MADNTFNFDLDAPAVPTLTLDPAPAQEQAQPKQPEPAAAPEAQVKLSPEEQAMVDQFAEKIDITNSQQGDKWIIYIPYAMGYGIKSFDSIPAYSTLIFEVELLGVA